MTVLARSFSGTLDGAHSLSLTAGNGTVTLAGVVGATPLSSLTIASAQLTNAGSYQVIVSNVVGAVTSSIARLTVVERPSILTQPVSVTNVAGCSSVAFSVVASGTEPLVRVMVEAQDPVQARNCAQRIADTLGG